MSATGRHTSFVLPSFHILLPSTCLLLAAVACSGGQDTANTGGAGGKESSTQSSGNGGTDNGTQSSGKGGTGNGGNGGENGVGGGGSPNGGSSGAGGNQSCISTTVDLQPTPVAMFIAIDRSGSMSGSKWYAVQTAFPSFWKDPSAQNLTVALKYWPDGGDCDDPACSATVCAQPVVGPGLLSDASFTQQLISSIQSTSPTGITPSSAALDGATRWAANYMLQNPGEKAVVLFVTDGDPTACNTSTSAIYDIATNAYQGAGVITYPIGMQGANQTFLHGLALAGGTTTEYMIGSSNTAQDLLSALKAIQYGTIGCEIAIPDAPPGKTIDPAQVVLTYTPPGGTPATITQAANVGACGPIGGFYFDNPSAPTKLLLCDATCKAVQSTPNGKLDLEMGCTSN